MLPCCTQVTTPEIEPVQRAVANTTLKLSRKRLAMLFQPNLSDATRMGPLDRFKEIFRTNKKLPALEEIHERIHRNSTSLFAQNLSFDLEEPAPESPSNTFSFGENLEDRVAYVRELLQPGLQNLLVVRTDPNTGEESVYFNNHEIYSLSLPRKLLSVWVDNKDLYTNWVMLVLEYANDNIDEFIAYQRELEVPDKDLITKDKLQQAINYNTVASADFLIPIVNFNWAKNPALERLRISFCKMSKEQVIKLLDWANANNTTLSRYISELYRQNLITSDEWDTYSHKIGSRAYYLTTVHSTFMDYQAAKAKADSSHSRTPSNAEIILEQRASRILNRRLTHLREIRRRNTAELSPTSLRSDEQLRQTLRRRRHTITFSTHQREPQNLSSINVTVTDELTQAKDDVKVMFDLLGEIKKTTNTSSIHVHPAFDTGKNLKQQLSKSLTTVASGSNAKPKKEPILGVEI